MEVWLNAIGSIGFPAVFAIYLVYQGYKDKQDYNSRIEEKDKENRTFTNERISELREEIKEVKRENKEDKKLFENPTSEYRGTPFWAWNCKLNKEEGSTINGIEAITEDEISNLAVTTNTASWSNGSVTLPIKIQNYE